MAALLCVATAVAYVPSFRAPFLLDDGLAITGNASIRHLANLRAVLASSNPTTAARPLLNLTFALNYVWSGNRVGSYHLVNLAIHLGAGLLLFGVVRRTLLLAQRAGRWGGAVLPASGLVAAIWLLHPLQTEAVTYLSQRAESLMGLCYLLTLYGLVRATTAAVPSRWLALSVGACFAGMATKEVMVTAPVIVLLFDWGVLGHPLRTALRSRRWYYLGLAASWLWLAFLMRGGSLAKGSAGFDVGVAWTVYAREEFQVVVRYLGLCFWPHPLVFDYGRETLAVDGWRWLAGAGLVAALLAAAVVLWRRSSAGGFLGLAFFILLAPTSSVVPLAAQPMAENRLYLPLAAVVAGVVLAATARFGRTARWGLLAVAAVCGALTWARNVDYESGLRLWTDTVAKQPASSRAHNNLAIELAAIPGREAEARQQLRQALALKPDYAEAYTNLANQLAKLPDSRTEAIADYEEALRIDPGYAVAHYNLANLLADRPATLAEGLAHYAEAIRLKPDYFEAQNNLAAALANLPGRLPEALAHYEAALQLKPDSYEIHYNLAGIDYRLGRRQDAIDQLAQALAANPNFVPAQEALRQLQFPRVR